MFFEGMVMNFANFKISSKLGFGFAIIVLLTA